MGSLPVFTVARAQLPQFFAPFSAVWIDTEQMFVYALS
jgi:hypothetical protein